MKDAEIWMCGPALDPAFVCEPSAPFPILQTYVDVCIAGCLEHDEKFAEMFVATTSGWSQYFLNDREVPRRPWVSSLPAQQNWKQIDTILGDDLLQFRALASEYGALHRKDILADVDNTKKRMSLLGSTPKTLLSSVNEPKLTPDPTQLPPEVPSPKESSLPELPSATLTPKSSFPKLISLVNDADKGDNQA